MGQGLLRSIAGLLGSRGGAKAAAPAGAAGPGLGPAEVPLLAAAPVHVMRDDGLAQLADGQLAIVARDGSREIVRLDEVAQLSLFGAASATSPCLGALMRRGIPVVFRSAGGYYLGQTADLSGVSTAVRRAQYRAAEQAARALGIARVLVKAKIVNQRGLLRRHLPGEAALDELARLARRAGAAADPPRLLGIEGAAAAAYYAALPRMIAAARRQDFAWDGRVRRPPTDAMNAMLSYLYAVAAGECAVAALAAGLDPALGFLHGERSGRPALALDLVEPFRAPVCDTVALAAVNRGEIRPEHFAAAGAVSLTDKGRRVLLAALERRWAETVPGASAAATGGRLTWREAVHGQARRLARSLVAGDAFASFERG